MADNSSSITMSHEYDVVVPENEKAYPIPVSDWAYLKKKINRISTSELLFQTIGAALLGLSASAFVTALTVPAPTSSQKLGALGIAWIVCALGLVCGLLTLWYASKERQLASISKTDVIEEMERLEKKYKTN